MRRSIRNLVQTIQRVAAGVRLQFWYSRGINRSMETTTLDPGNWQEIQDKTKQYDEIVRNRHMSPEEVNAMRLAFQQNPPHRNPGEYKAANRPYVRFYTAGAALAVFMVVAELVRRTKR